MNKAIKILILKSCDLKVEFSSEMSKEHSLRDTDKLLKLVAQKDIIDEVLKRIVEDE